MVSVIVNSTSLSIVCLLVWSLPLGSASADSKCDLGFRSSSLTSCVIICKHLIPFPPICTLPADPSSPLTRKQPTRFRGSSPHYSS
ncbi:hypothetical protein PF008_g12117 [Phytophthora fragariae]|uniref:RxLR effector protein n=1 Tax=Phytophthora fragariae TaxID=53985 RepID=A0A6G0RNZ2_9STRA|nr:hypothetical protein PF008_g12117 [Phytophthora fragariae]